MVIYAMHPLIYAPITPIEPSYQSLFCLNNRRALSTILV